jgi:hypothetical protein
LGSPQLAAVAMPIPCSAKVRHPQYESAPSSASATDDDRRLSVTFPGRGTKKFVERYAQLQQI